ncbi:MAG: hypothetical protein PHQ35_00510 [Phycisphaerae bacterium]|nr:hypothetical protein [Phycisphaerae bacterium]MDD5381450.1 hypothetical protein [Phycisphaerae bacterium]
MHDEFIFNKAVPVPVARQAGEYDMHDPAYLDSVIDRMLPVCKVARSVNAYHLEPSALKGGTRDWVYICMNWIGVPSDTIPYNHIFIYSRKSGLSVPGKVELSTESSQEHPQGDSSLFFYILHDLHISLKGVAAIIAHECTHLYLIKQGKQKWKGTSTILDSEDEIATDVASIILGLGKVVLNGVCDYTMKKPSERIGYLTVADFGYVYAMTGVKLGLTPSILRQGLIPSAIAILPRGKI